MKITTRKTLKILNIIIGLTTTITLAQQQNTNLQQDDTFEQLLNEKRKINSAIIVNQRYKIQVFSGSSDGAKKTLAECKQDFKDLDGTIIFNTPNYKVWIGNFRTRIEAERLMVEIKRKYPNALLIKPEK
ncbi:SPOR domain-containing protein [Flavobacterium sp. UMI-01]|uniref:SPOR domain-containing protein n=1 Tax=Flavobacterium sp. UMI-01 TaxID=1441053 RepID=UPI001C7D05B9|nr:SPOR domain-containing protein [Flavobacterium sp. UMI-01]GIZ10406.1 sporulation protein [Flavobacterium sp. UMI-01]